jgi:FkbM family methyltransferase
MLHEIIKKYNIKVVYDIGAHKGQFTQRYQKLLPNAIFHQFEASPNKNGKGNWHKVVLSHTDDIAIKFYHDGWNGDTYYRETDEFLKSKYKTSMLTTQRLDTYILENDIPLPDLIKIDVQGAELDILRGCNDIMHHCQLIHCEIPAEGIEFNKGSPTQKEYLEFLESYGFKYRVKEKDHKRDGRLIIQHDYVFAKDQI